MGRKSGKQQILNDTYGILLFGVLYEEIFEEPFWGGEEDEDDGVLDDEIHDILLAIYFLGPFEQYLNTRLPLPRLIDPLELYLKYFPDDRFKSYFQMTKFAFLHLLGMIEWHPMFHNQSQRKQK